MSVDTALARYTSEDLNPVRCFPNSFKTIWTQEYEGKDPTPADQQAWADYNVGLPVGGVTSFSVLLFSSEDSYSAFLDPLLQGAIERGLTAVKNPDGTVAIWFRNNTSERMNGEYQTLPDKPRLIQRGWTAPAPPSMVGNQMTEFLVEGKPLIQDWTPPKAETKIFRVRPFSLQAIPLRGMMAFAPPSQPAFVDGGLLDAGGRVLIAGVPKIGKSRFALNFAFSLATSKPFLGLKTNGLPRVLFVQFEVSENRFRQRVNAIARKWHIPPDNDVPLNLITLPSLKLDKGQGASEFRRMIRVFKAEVVFLDPMTKLHTADENDQQSMVQLLDTIDDIVDETGTAVVIVHHQSKARESESWARIRGSSYIAGWAESLLILDKHGDSGDRKVEALLRNGEPFTKSIRFGEDHTMTVVGSEEDSMRSFIVQQMIDDPGANKKALASMTSKTYGKDINQVYGLIRAMEAEGTQFP